MVSGLLAHPSLQAPAPSSSTQDCSSASLPCCAALISSPVTSSRSDQPWRSDATTPASPCKASKPFPVRAVMAAPAPTMRALPCRPLCCPKGSSCSAPISGQLRAPAHFCDVACSSQSAARLNRCLAPLVEEHAPSLLTLHIVSVALFLAHSLGNSRALMDSYKPALPPSLFMALLAAPLHRFPLLPAGPPAPTAPFDPVCNSNGRNPLARLSRPDVPASMASRVPFAAVTATSPLRTNQKWLRNVAAPFCTPDGAASSSRLGQPQRDASTTPRREDSRPLAHSSAYAGPSPTPVAPLYLVDPGQPTAQFQHLLMHSVPSRAIECPPFLSAISAVPCTCTSVSGGVSPTPPSYDLDVSRQSAARVHLFLAATIEQQSNAATSSLSTPSCGHVCPSRASAAYTPLDSYGDLTGPRQSSRQGQSMYLALRLPTSPSTSSHGPALFHSNLLVFLSATTSNDCAPSASNSTPPWPPLSAIQWRSIPPTVNGSSPSPLIVTPLHSSALRPLSVSLFHPVQLSSLPDYFLDANSNVYIDALQRAWEVDSNTDDASWDIFFQKFTDHPIPEILLPVLLIPVYQLINHMQAYLDLLHLAQRTIPSDLDPDAYVDHTMFAESLQQIASSKHFNADTTSPFFCGNPSSYLCGRPQLPYFRFLYLDDATIWQGHLSVAPSSVQVLPVTAHFFVLSLQQNPSYHVPFDPGILKCCISQLEGGEMVTDTSLSYADSRMQNHKIKRNGKLLSTTHYCAKQSHEAELTQHATISLLL